MRLYLSQMRGGGRGNDRRRYDGVDKDWAGDFAALRHSTNHHRESRVPEKKGTRCTSLCCPNLLEHHLLSK